ncbi:MAG: SMP-30/gluconolactonase/LRE family protein [Micromonosporaceae bacterium]
MYRVPANGGGEAELLVDESEFDQPNGLCFSPDERILYVNDSPRAHVKAFPVRARTSRQRDCRTSDAARRLGPAGSPHLLGGLQDQLKLRVLLVPGQRVPLGGG